MAFAVDALICTVASAAGNPLFGEAVLSASEASALYGTSTLSLSGPFTLYLWQGFLVPAPINSTSAPSIAFNLASDPTFAPPPTMNRATLAGPHFTLSTAQGGSAPGLAGIASAPPAALYLAQDFRLPAAAMTSSALAPPTRLTLANGFDALVLGNSGSLAGPAFPAYLARGFSPLAQGLATTVVTMPFPLSMGPSSSPGLVASWPSGAFPIYSTGAFVVPAPVRQASFSSQQFALAMQSPFVAPATYFTGVGASPQFATYLVANYVRPRDALSAFARSAGFELALLALAGGRQGFALSPPFELRLYDETVPVLVSVVRAEFLDGAARVTWELADGDQREFTIQRMNSDSLWARISSAMTDGLGRVDVSDASVVPGQRYGYRLARPDLASAGIGEIWMDIPLYIFGLAGATPNPTISNRLAVRFTLPDARPAQLELLDVAGRKIVSTEVGNLGPGQHTVDLATGRRVPPGMYFIRLTRPGQHLVRKASVTN